MNVEYTVYEKKLSDKLGVKSESLTLLVCWNKSVAGT